MSDLYAAEGLDGAMEEIDRLTGILARVHNELHDPMGQYWCDQPIKDRNLLVNLRDYVDEEMDWLIEGPNA